MAWCVLAGRLKLAGLTAPIVFVACGWVFADVFGLFDLEVVPELVKLIAVVTLVWVLFADASRVRLGQFRGPSSPVLLGRARSLDLPTSQRQCQRKAPYRAR